MKSDLAPSIVEESILNNIVEVKETVATGIKMANTSPRSFGVIDLWNIRRNARLASATVRRY
jgi:hypothetical protein